MGTPEFAATVLRRLLLPDSPVEIVAAVSQPDKPVGRQQVLTPPPVKVAAREHEIPVLQPASLRRPRAVQALRKTQPDLGIVAAYGKLLPPEVLAIAPRGFLNVHASVLPRWRGAWPVGAAILAGDDETGVSIMVLDEEMDTCPVLSTRREPIRLEDTTATLEARLAVLGADLLIETLPRYLAGTLPPQPQDDRRATYCHVVRKEGGTIDWSKSAAEIERQVRAMRPWPIASTTWDGKRLNILRVHVAGSQNASAMSQDQSQEPGTVVPLGKAAAVITGDGSLALEEVQLEGRGPTPVKAFVNGYRTFIGSRLGA